MPLRNEFPTLKGLAFRKLSWPDGIGRKENESYPSNRACIRNSIELNYIKDKDNFLNRMLEQNQMKDFSNTIVNSWIRLSNYYKTALIEFRQNALFLALQPVSCLDFLNYCNSLLRNPDQIPELAFLMGVIPFTSIPQRMDPKTWTEIVEILSMTKADSEVQRLCVYFENSKKKSITTKFDFNRTIQGFFNLKKIVAHGDADDTFLQTVGRCCPFVEYLDVRGTRVTKDGVLKLLYKHPQNIQKYLEGDNFLRSIQIPQNALRPLTARCPLIIADFHPILRLTYLDVSTMNKSRILYKDYHPVLLACPTLVVTPRAFFFQPNGKPRFICKLNDDWSEVHLKIMQCVRSVFCIPLLDFVRELRSYFDMTELEIRTNKLGEEVGFLFYNLKMLVVHLEIKQFDVTSIICYTSSVFAFVSLDLTSRFASNVCQIKASLGYAVNVNTEFPNLTSVTAAIIESKIVLKKIITLSKNLKYLEVRAILKTVAALDDSDLEECFQRKNTEFEVLRLLFHNEITLCGGIKRVLTLCSHMRMIGDVAFFNITEEQIKGSLISLSLHNFEFMYEYKNVIHHTTTPFGQLYSNGNFDLNRFS